MARTIEGGITLVDLTDGQSYYTFVRYSKNADGSGYVDTPSSETIYIGVYAGPLSSPPVYSDSGWTWSKYVGDDGGQGPQGVSVTSGRELYYLTTTGTAPSQITAANQIVSTDTPNRWSSVVATYQTGADYYTCIETTLSNEQKVWSAPSKNIALTTASADAQEAKTIATGINQYFWWIPNDHSTSVKAGVYMTQIPSATFKDTPAGGNIIMRSDGMYIRHGATLDAQVTSSGLTVKKGGIEAGTFNSNNYVYAWSEDRSDRALAINGSGSKTDWRFLAGKQFGVDKAGNLYASGANIQGQVTITAGSNVYTKDEVDDAVGEVNADLSRAKSEIKVTTDGISSEVSKKTDKDSIISTIRQSAETVKIKASQVEIDGTATFNAIKSSTDAAYDTKGAASAALGNAYNAMGGFTILWDSNAGTTYAGGEAKICKYDPETGTVSQAAGWAMWNGTKRTVPNVEFNPNSVLPYNIPIYLVLRLSSATSTTGTVYPVWYASGWKYNTKLSAPAAADTADWTWVEATDMVLGKCVEPSVEGVFTECETYNPPWNFKAVSNITTTAASAQSTANAAAPKTSAVAEEQYIYISKASGTTSVNGTTSWVTESGDKQNTWTTKRPTYNSSYPVLFVAKQKKVVSGTVTCTTPVKDDTTTIIDGGHITTGTIDASKATITNINGANILTNSIGANQIKANAIDTSKLTIGAQDEMLNSKIEIGGRNLLIENGNFPDSSASFNNHTITNTITDTKINFRAQLQNYNSSKSYVNGLTPGAQNYTSTGHKVWTFEVANTTQSNGYIRLKHNGSSRDIGVLFKFGEQLSAGDIVTISFDLDGYNPSIVGGLIIKNIKLEKGNKATDWTPAPEDVQAEIDAKKSVHTLTTNYSYTYAQILTYSGEGNTSHGAWAVTSASGVKVGDTVRLKVTVSNMSNAPVYVIGTVTAVSGNNVTMTSHGVDTTIIDGGNILTNSIGANQIAANAITIGKMPSSDLEQILNSKVDVPSKVSELTNDSGFQTASQVTSTVNAVRSWYATCSTEAATAAKVATITPTTTSFTTSVLKAGTVVIIKFTTTNTANIANLTLNVNGTGAKPIKTIRYGVLNNIAGAGYLAAGVTYQFTYDGTNWVMQENYNADTINRTRWQNVIAAAEAITAGRIICGTASGYRNIAANVSFDMAYPLLYAATAIAKGATTGTRDNNFLEINSIAASNNGTITSGAANKVLFLKGKLSNNEFTIAASPFMTTVVPSSQDNFHYIPLGIMYSATNIYFRSSDQIYMYKDGAFGPVSVREASVAAKTATNYITDIGNDGIRVHPASTENNSVLINSDGMTVYKGGTADKDSVAFYGDTARIGKKASRHVEVKTGGMQVYNGEGDSNMVTHIGYESVQGETGTTMGAFFTFGSRRRNQMKGEWSVAEGIDTTASGWCSHAEGFFTTASSYDSHAEGHGTTASGRNSHAEGIDTTASGYCSHAEGDNTTASGYDSHAEGYETTASGDRSHAEGYYATASGWFSHAEGNNTTASGSSSHAEGNNTTASGIGSHAGGGFTHASRNYQTVIGKYNKIRSGSGTKDSPYVSTDAAFIIGGGTARTTSDSKDIFIVGWDGNVELAIDSSATGSSTVDGKIMDSLRSLGWDASTEGVIV